MRVAALLLAAVALLGSELVKPEKKVEVRLKEVARAGGNLFEELLNAAKVCSLGQISQALYEVGGQYRRNM